MSTPIETIHAQNFDDVDELFENTQNLSSTAQCSHILGQKNDEIQRIPKARFYGPGQYPSTLANGSSTISIAAGGDQELNGTAEIRLKSVGAQKFMIGGVTKLQINSVFDNARVYTHLQTYPNGSGRYMYADAFVQWCSKVFKDNILPIPENVSQKAMPPRRYTQNGKPKLGFVVEEMPDEVVESIDDGEGGINKGLDLLGVCAIQQAKIEALEQRVFALERRP